MEFQIEWKMISIQGPPSHFSQLIDDRVGQICQSRRYAQQQSAVSWELDRGGDKPGFYHIGTGLWVNQGQIVEIPFFEAEALFCGDLFVTTRVADNQW